MYMSPFDVHFNYAPWPGRWLPRRYTKADANLPMVDLAEYIRIAFLRRPFDNFAAAFHFANERNTVVIAAEGASDGPTRPAGNRTSPSWRSRTSS